ncbi:MAG: 4-alpha-glucanotransferase [Anaerolineae bacterium]|nr:4-alpha-glucanotransferase [Anaerolineae bacterium]
MARASGILLHPTSLPSPYGIGDLGEDAYRFVDFLAEAEQQLWQVLPLGPTGFGDSPYQCFSAFAGNPLLISPALLAQEGLLPARALEDAPRFPATRVDYGAVIPYKQALLRAAYAHFQQDAPTELRQAFEAFCEQESAWLEDYALFMALKDAHDGDPWNTWADDLVQRAPNALARARHRLREAIQLHKFAQFVFFRQWSALKAYANAKGVRIIGDIPIFVAFDSADAWAHRELFTIDERGELQFVAGVPPDYFSPTGQRWGNPLYRWEVMAAQGYRWWIDRCRMALRLFDLVRIDHFRGFEAYWEVPAHEPTAVNGRWVKGPGLALFQALREALGELPIIAEDLGVITDEVRALRDALGFPGMRVLHFAFVADASSEFLPHNYVRNTVAYAGTHDNDTTVGWFEKLDAETRQRVLDYIGTDGSAIHWDVIRLLMMSVADTVIFTLQDVLGLGSEARMNFPGRAEGNWQWRFTWAQITPEIAARLRKLTRTYGRSVIKQPSAPR